MKLAIAVLFAGLALGAWAEGHAMGKEEAQIIKARMIPYPKQVAINDGAIIKIDTQLAVTVTLTNRIDGLEKRTARELSHLVPLLLSAEAHAPLIVS